MRWITICAMLGSFACDNSDVGDQCSDMIVPVPSSGSSEGDLQSAHGSEIVEYNATFPCTSTVCVASLGRGAFCSAECKTDDHCPKAFECRQILTDLDPATLPKEIADMITQKYCIWRNCNTDDDCGGDFDYVCAKVEELSLGGEIVRQCGRR